MAKSRKTTLRNVIDAFDKSSVGDRLAVLELLPKLFGYANTDDFIFALRLITGSPPRRGAKPILTQEKLHILIRRSLAHVPNEKIAAELGVSPQTVSNTASRLRLAARRPTRGLESISWTQRGILKRAAIRGQTLVSGYELLAARSLEKNGFGKLSEGPSLRSSWFTISDKGCRRLA